ncbi:MAG: hypothetical protein ABI651_09930 [Verrucomicrobiota bacterium]
MDPKLLTESGWKAVTAKFKIKDNGLQRALAAYENLEDDEHDVCLKGIASIQELAATLKRAKEVAGNAAVVKYLNDLAKAAEEDERDIAKAKAAAEKARATADKAKADAEKAEAEAQKAEAKAKKMAEAGTEDDGAEEQDEEDDESDYETKLLAAFQKLKSAKDVAYQFVVCDAKPHCGVMIAKKITSKHKEQLTKITGSKRFLHVGTCRMEEGRFTFSTEKPAPGLARKLQDSIKHFTGKKLPIRVGTESVDEDDDEGNLGPIAPPKLPKAELTKAPEVWRGTRDILDKNIKALKKAIQAQYGDEQPVLIDEINENIEKMDSVLEKLDNRLADSLTKAYAAKDNDARRLELKISKAILAEYINYVKSDPLIAHIDANPFGVKTNLKAVLTGSLTHMAQAIG